MQLIRDAEVLEPGTAIVSDSKRLKTIVARAKQEEATIRTDELKRYELHNTT